MPDSDNRCTEIFLHVKGECAKWRHVQHASGGSALRFERDESIDGDEKRRQRLAAAGGCRNQRVIAREDLRKTSGLRVGCGRKRRREPRSNG